MNTKHDILTEEELDKFKLRTSALNYIDECAVRLGILPEKLRILDWGCGRGRTVAKLLEMGIDVYGVDIDPEPIKNGHDLLYLRGEDPAKRLICIDQSCRTPFPEKFFDLVISDQVLEHANNLNHLVIELSRITADDGEGLHNFPAKWCFIEPHLFLPFLHWLPKNRLRLWYLRLLLFRIPTWEGMENKTSKERAQIYYAYSTQKTYYRPLGVIQQTFSQQRFKVNIRSTGSARLSLKVCFPFLFFNNHFSKKFWHWWSKNFREIELTASRTKKNDNI